ncbi:hypothetical protein E4U24_007290 [Claviceps purpurea]|nr:hypothetical protein E4U24_007290 [Claviceps purpurea]
MILAPSSKALLKAIIALAAKHSAGSEGDASGSTGKQKVLLGGYNVNNVRKLYIVSFDNLAAMGHADDLKAERARSFFRDEYDRPHLLDSRHGSNLLGSFPRAFHVVKLGRKASEDLGVERSADGGLATDVFEMCRMAL